MAVHHLPLHIIVLLLCLIEVSSKRNYSCPSSCNATATVDDLNYYMFYPFGIGEGCYFDKRFEVICHDHKPLLASSKAEIIDIQYYATFPPPAEITLTVNISVITNGNKTSTGKKVDLSDKRFPVSNDSNWIALIGCDNYNTINHGTKELVNAHGCLPTLSCDPTQEAGCYEFICPFPLDRKLIGRNIRAPAGCKSAFVVERNSLQPTHALRIPSEVLKDGDNIPLGLQWGKELGTCLELYGSHDTIFCQKGKYTEHCSIKLSSNLVCQCSRLSHKGCAGNLLCIPSSKNNCSKCPDGYDADGQNNDLYCKPKNYDKKYDEIFKTSHITVFIITGCIGGLGTLLFVIGVCWLYKLIKRKQAIKLKQKFFRRNGGLLLKQHLSSNAGKIEKTKLFTSEELEKATDNYNANRILGQGGQGTVYKGMMSEGSIVAIKKSKIVDESKLEEFINEVVILSQINHRSVVQLLGCCLETEVPLLVYEFIPNGTLFEYIHGENEEFPITWELRLRIATEIAGALSYLHSAASMPIYHRDIKSKNILLDDKYRAKVSDFGTSRSMTIDETHLTTQVQGTFGYLDPEYFRSSQFTDKSDVYSFGVVLAELLTGQKPIRSNDYEDRSLAAYFLCAMKENRLFEILDARVLKEGEKEEISVVANLTGRCLNLNGKKRPTMKEVAMELMLIRNSNGASIMQQNIQELDNINDDYTTDRSETDSSIIEIVSL